MESTMQLIFLVVLLKVISAQINEQEIAGLWASIPKLSTPQCQQIPTDAPSQCCIIPDLFDKKTNAGCIRPDDKPAQEPAVRGSPECAEKNCILRNNDLLLDNDEIDKDSFKQHLNEWVAKRKEFMPAVNAAKDVCLGNKPLFGPNEMCDADRLLWCITSNLYNKCPYWLDTDSCATTRAFMENCLPYYFDKDIPK
ncbi:general odorant-binding protein 66-like [Cydia splendana]|uniref:general odorant-binding protein 66-like n=1 Tax=Cydia splendana TaxID=1100963 RepID=UPI0028F47D98